MKYKDKHISLPLGSSRTHGNWLLLESCLLGSTGPATLTGCPGAGSTER